MAVNGSIPIMCLICVVSQKHATLLLFITLTNISLADFENSFTVELSTEFSTISLTYRTFSRRHSLPLKPRHYGAIEVSLLLLLLYLPPHPKH